MIQYAEVGTEIGNTVTIVVLAATEHHLYHIIIMIHIQLNMIQDVIHPKEELDQEVEVFQKIELEKGQDMMLIEEGVIHVIITLRVVRGMIQIEQEVIAIIGIEFMNQPVPQEIIEIMIGIVAIPGTFLHMVHRRIFMQKVVL